MRKHVGHFAFDVESTGLSYKNHHIIEIAAVPIWSDVAPFHCFVRPEPHQWSEWAVKNVQKNFPANWQSKALDRKDAAWKFGMYIDNLLPAGEAARLVAHNADFDRRMIDRMYTDIGMQRPNYFPICTMVKFFHKYGGKKRTSLRDAMERCNLPQYNWHNALDDAKAVKKLFLHLSS